MKNYDMIIIGGGLVGASLACALQSLPLRVAVVEALPMSTRLDNNFDERSIALALGSQRIYQALGLWSALQPYAQAIKAIHVSDRGHFGASYFKAEEENIEAFGYVIPIQQLTRVLYEACQTIHSIDYLCPEKVADLTINEENALVYLENCDEPLQTKLIVAADGDHSTVRKLQQIKTTVKDYQQQAIVATIGLQRDHQNIAYERFTHEGPLALLPLLRQRAALVWSVSPEHAQQLLALDDQTFLQALQQTFGYRLGRFIKIGQRKTFPLRLIQAEQSIAERLVLVGNAAHSLPPIAAQGFNLGLRDAAVLAQVVAENNNALGSMSMLEHYMRARQRDQQRIIMFTDQLTRLFSNKLWPFSVMRDFCLGALNGMTPAKKILLRHTMGLAGRCPQLACGVPLTMQQL